MPSSSGSSRLRNLTHISNISWKAGSSPLVPSGKPNVCVCVCVCVCISSVQYSCSVVPDSLRPHGLKHTRLPCPSLTPRACSNCCPSSQRCHPTISSSVVPFSSHLQAFPGSGSFQVSQFFVSCGQSIGVSASTSVLPKNIQD